MSKVLAASLGGFEFISSEPTENRTLEVRGMLDPSTPTVRRR